MRVVVVTNQKFQVCILAKIIQNTIFAKILHSIPLIKETKMKTTNVPIQPNIFINTCSCPFIFDKGRYLTFSQFHASDVFLIVGYFLQKRPKEREVFFLENGARLLQESIASL